MSYSESGSGTATASDLRGNVASAAPERVIEIRIARGDTECAQATGLGVSNRARRHKERSVRGALIGLHLRVPPQAAMAPGGDEGQGSTAVGAGNHWTKHSRVATRGGRRLLTGEGCT